MSKRKRLALLLDTWNVDSFTTLTEQFWFICRTKNLTPKTIDGYAERLEHLYRWLRERKIDLQDVRRIDIQQYINGLLGTVSDETVNGRIRVYRRFWNVLVDEELWDKPNPMHKVGLIRAERKIRPVLSVEQFSHLLAMCTRRSFEGYRNHLLLLLLWDAMLRLSEVVTFRTEDVNLQEGIIKVRGKGRRQREVPISPKVQKTIHYWLHKHRAGLPGPTLICKRDGNELTGDRVEKIIAGLGKRAGLKVYPHLLRHSGASLWVKHGGNSFTLQRVLGHAHISTTQRYVTLDTTALKEAHERFTPSRDLVW